MEWPAAVLVSGGVYVRFLVVGNGLVVPNLVVFPVGWSVGPLRGPDGRTNHPDPISSESAGVQTVLEQPWAKLSPPKKLSRQPRLTKFSSDLTDQRQFNAMGSP